MISSGKMEEERKVEIYKVVEGEVVFDVDEQKETIWATQAQIARLFDVNPQAITRHLKHIYEEGELEETRTCSILEQVQVEGEKEGGRVVRRKVKKYNLDAIISVGYRVNSRKATDFRIWATKTLHNYVVKGVAVNERRLAELDSQKLREVEKAVGVVRRLMLKSELSAGEASGILEVIARYAGSFEVLKEYQAGQIKFGSGRRGRRRLTEIDFEKYIENLRRKREEGEEFGRWREEAGGLAERLTRIEVEYGEGKVAKKAAELLWLVAKEQPFVKGNEEIGALLFIVFLTLNDYQLTRQGETKISDRALTALVLLIKESRAEEKELMVALVCKLLDG